MEAQLAVLCYLDGLWDTYIYIYCLFMYSFAPIGHPKVSQGDDGTHIPTLKCCCWCSWMVPGSDYDFWMILGGGLHGVLRKGFRYNLYIYICI